MTNIRYFLYILQPCKNLCKPAEKGCLIVLSFSSIKLSFLAHRLCRDVTWNIFKLNLSIHEAGSKSGSFVLVTNCLGICKVVSYISSAVELFEADLIAVLSLRKSNEMFWNQEVRFSAVFSDPLREWWKCCHTVSFRMIGRGASSIFTK